MQTSPKWQGVESGLRRLLYRAPRLPATSRNGPCNSGIRHCEFGSRTNFLQTRDQVLSLTTWYALQYSTGPPVLERIPNRPDSRQSGLASWPSRAEDVFSHYPTPAREALVCDRAGFPVAIAIPHTKL